jgi:hypothetical protein
MTLKVLFKSFSHRWQQTHAFSIGSGQVVNISLEIFEIPNSNTIHPTAAILGPMIICMERD